MREIGVFILLLWYVLGEDLYTIKSSVTPLNNKNFQKQISNQRLRDVSIVFLYKDVGMFLFSNLHRRQRNRPSTQIRRVCK